MVKDRDKLLLDNAQAKTHFVFLPVTCQ